MPQGDGRLPLTAVYDRSNSLRHRERESLRPGVLMHHVEADHHHIPNVVVLKGCPEHLVLEVAGRGLGGPEVPEFALVLLLE